jgi:signal transduction histidine kinase
MKSVSMLFFLLIINVATSPSLPEIFLRNELLDINISRLNHDLIVVDKNGNAINNGIYDNVFNFGISANEAGFKFRLVNQTDFNTLNLFIGNPIIDSVLVTISYTNGTLSNLLLTQWDIKQRSYPNPNYIFPFSIEKNDTVDIKIFCFSSTPLVFPIKILSSNSVIKKTTTLNLVSGIYFGVMLIMFLYNLFLFFSTKEKSYLFYVVYIFCVAITQGILHGFAHFYIWPNNQWLTLNMVSVSGGLVGIATVLFIKSFLQTSSYSTFVNVGLNVIIIFDLIGVLFGILEFRRLSYVIVDLTAGIGSFYVLFIGFYIYTKGSREAGFFLLSWTIFLVSVIIFVLKNHGLVPYNEYTLYAMQFGSAIEASLLSFALADKINTYRAEKEQAQLQALHTARENERIIKEQNLILEGRVEERTRELQKSNDELEFTLTNLKQTQTQLVEQEKMASLGQLTAGIAHEINNPINFVSSNVKPLKRDMDMMIDLLNRIEQIALSDILQQQKQEQIQKIKTEYDFEYLKEEVGFLLKGIEEGAVRTADIVRGLRIFSRVDEDDLKIADIHEGIDSTLIITTNLMNGKIKLIKNYCDTQKVECYPGKLNQVFLNIISNAVYAIKQKYNDKEGGVLTITTNCDGKYFIIAITDNGCGMPDEVKNKIFEPFFTTKPVGEGTGLGMSIAITTIQRHNGSLDVTSALGEGTTFTIKIPIKQS